jgi:hypothetical protein
MARKCLNFLGVLSVIEVRKNVTCQKDEKGKEGKKIDPSFSYSSHGAKAIVKQFPHTALETSPKPVTDSLSVCSPVIPFQLIFHVSVTFFQQPTPSDLLIKDVPARCPRRVRVTCKNVESSSTM